MLTESSTQFTDQPRDADAAILIQHARIADLESQVECLQKQLQELAEKLGNSSRYQFQTAIF